MDEQIPFFVTMAQGFRFSFDGTSHSGKIIGGDVGIRVLRVGDRASLTEPFNGTHVSMDAKGLNAVNVIVGHGGHGTSVHVLGNYAAEYVTFRCCVSCDGTTACCNSACLTCSGGTTVCC
jgi:hypothetical protein